VNETERLAAVRRYQIIYASPDRAFDRITALAARLLNAPIAIVSIVDQDRIWFKSRHGIGLEYVERDLGLCASCVLQDSPWVVADAKSDLRALDNPLVAGEAGIQFYLGIPLRTRDGFNLGALCVLDVVPRTPTEADIACLKDLAVLVMEELELQLSARRLLASYHEELARRELREDRIKGLLRELAHRAKNLLAVIQAIARHTAPETGAERSYAHALRARIAGLSYTHDLVAEEEWRGARLLDLAGRQLSHFIEPVPPRVELDGPELLIAPAAAQQLGLALHELGANAVEHGSLKTLQGKVSFQWRLEGTLSAQPWLHLHWRELNGPPAKPPQRKKFGTLVLERLVPDGLAGSATLSFEEPGLTWTCEMPSNPIVVAS
jgi:two-component sensor histidine kinase